MGTLWVPFTGGCENDSIEFVSVLETTQVGAPSGADFDMATPPGVSEGMVLLASITSSVTFDLGELPEGWTAVQMLTFPHHIVAWYVCPESVPATHPFDIGLTIHDTFGAMLAFSGVDTTNPINTFSSGQQGGGGTSHVTESLTTTVNNCMLVSTLGGRGTATAWTAPGSMDQRSEVGVGDRRDATATELLGAAGPSGTRTWTSDFESNSRRINVALTPACIE